MSKTLIKENNGEKQITLEIGLTESIRRRPKLYLGSTGIQGMQNIISSLVLFVMNKNAKRIEVDINDKEVFINADQADFSIADLQEFDEDIPLLNKLHALCESFEIYGEQNKRTWQLSLENNLLKEKYVPSRQEIVFHLHLNDDIFDANFSYELLVRQFKQWQYLYPVEFKAREKKQVTSVYKENGLVSFLNEETGSSDVLYIEIDNKQSFNLLQKKQEDSRKIKLALCWNDQIKPVSRVYVNNNLVENGTHVLALKTGVKRGLKKIANQSGLLEGKKLKQDKALKHMHYAMQLELPRPQYDSWNRNKLIDNYGDIMAAQIELAVIEALSSDKGWTTKLLKTII